MFDAFKKNKKEPKQTDLLQIYQQALKQSANNDTEVKKIQAFDDVLRFCFSDMSCINDISRKRDTILYWTYSNIGDIFVSQLDKSDDFSAYKKALENYQHALNFASNSQEKIAVLQRLTSLYEKFGDWDNFYTIKDMLIESYSEKDRRQEYENLADSTNIFRNKIYFLEKSLDFIKNEEVSVLDRCKNTVRICDKLRTLYAEKQDFANLARIEELRNNTLFLIH